ncbi:hypothetical protein BCR37DRAFT_376485 [Protomyces lactucae-debilis]|uniref:Uncharacterized protein n=1 Tax=Protomyces lactucae-debilis TaxID=2754530 RepID=A0A1Y2FT32_PROLT|nr:uncharacterized protein BCR37DRAFT_376485 [Protomyces lactucae-debilis]ORY87099.1 hypothetical protein BCR37DRAFT_376485 [Protomyces lactucae-debilis]
MQPLTSLSLWMVPTSLLLLSLLSTVLHQPTAATPMWPARTGSTSHAAAGTGNSIDSSTTEDAIASPQYEKDFWLLNNDDQPTFYKALFSLSSVMSEAATDACNGGDPKIFKVQSDRCEKTCSNARSRYADHYVRVLTPKSTRRKSDGCVRGTDIHIEDMEFVHKLSFLTRVCAWQCSCKIFNRVEYIQMPQVTYKKHQILELSPRHDEAYWKNYRGFHQHSTRCHVTTIQAWVSQAASEAQSEEFAKIKWEVRLEAIVDEHITVPSTIFDEQMSMECYCARRGKSSRHRYLRGYCLKGHLRHTNPKKDHPSQDVASNNQQMCPWPPTMNPLYGSAAHSPGSGQMPSGLSHYPQSSHRAGAAGSSHQLTSEQLRDQQYELWVVNMFGSGQVNSVPNNDGVPEPVTLWPQQCLLNNPSEYQSDQYQAAPAYGESSGQGNPSQHYDYSVDQQHAHTQRGQQIDIDLFNWYQNWYQNRDRNGRNGHVANSWPPVPFR